jgi:hypothetical protein
MRNQSSSEEDDELLSLWCFFSNVSEWMLLSGITILLLCFYEVSILEYLTENTLAVKIPPIITHINNIEHIPNVVT